LAAASAVGSAASSTRVLAGAGLSALLAFVGGLVGRLVSLGSDVSALAGRLDGDRAANDAVNVEAALVKTTSSAQSTS
jgi:hypothetical protein